jgi:CheY-like chemotaxis protein
MAPCAAFEERLMRSRIDLSGKRILVVDDDPFIADGLSLELQAMGASVLGPVYSESLALDLLAHADGIEGAILNPMLRGKNSFELARVFRNLDVPFVFMTDGQADHVPRELSDVPVCMFPFSSDALWNALFPAGLTEDTTRISKDKRKKGP